MSMNSGLGLVLIVVASVVVSCATVVVVADLDVVFVVLMGMMVV